MILSTAGSRDSINGSKNYQQKTLDDAGKFFVKFLRDDDSISPYLASDVPVNVSVVSGRYEGMYGFLAFFKKA